MITQNIIISNNQSPKINQMQNLYISPTTKTPEINFKTNGLLSIKGSSYPENVKDFYEPVMLWLVDFLKTFNNSIELNIDLKYINTSSIKVLLNVIMEIRSSSKSTVKVEWQYEVEDDDMLATGEDLANLSNIKFEFKEK